MTDATGNNGGSLKPVAGKEVLLQKPALIRRQS
jgi:hypothetical protein